MELNDIRPGYFPIDAAPADATAFFLSDPWLRTVLRTAPDAASLSLLTDKGSVRALLGYYRGRRHRLLPVRRWYLNETGDVAFDRITLEYNGFAGLGEDSAATRSAFAWLLANLPAADELVVRNATRATANALRLAAAESGWRVRTTNRSPAAVLDLESLRVAGGDWLAGLGRNTRAAIRRAIRLYEATGPLTVERAATAPDALAWFERMGELHMASWQGRAAENAFTNPHFRPFHRALLQEAVPAGRADMLRIGAGGREIGYLYNFRAGGWTMAYQAGLTPPPDNRWKPGLVCHAAAIGLCLERGDRAYDFLAGPARYKTSLANREIPMESLVAFAPKWHLKVENAARRLKEKYRTLG